MKSFFLCLVLVVLTHLAVANVFAQPRISLPGDFNHLLNKPYNGAFAIAPDRRLAVAMSTAMSPAQTGILTSFDPVTGTVFDTETVGFGPTQVALIPVSGGYRVAAMYRPAGSRTIAIYDLSYDGILTPRAPAPLDTTSGQETELKLSRNLRAAFVWLHKNSVDQLESVNLDNGTLIDQLVTTGSERLEYFEDDSRRLIAMGRASQVYFFEVSTDGHLTALGATALPVAGEVNALPLVFSADGHYLFAGAEKLVVIDTATRAVVGSIENVFGSHLRLFSHGSRQLLADWPGVGNTISVVDVNDPVHPQLVNQVALNDIPQIIDADFSADGKRVVYLNRESVGALSIPSLARLWSNTLDTQAGFKVQVFGPYDHILGAWGSTSNFGATIYSLPDRTNLRSNFDGDSRSDIGVYRPSTGNWYWLNSHDSSLGTVHVGQSGDVAVPADYDGDGITDAAVYRPSDGNWYIRDSSTSKVHPFAFGLSSDEPVPGDYDGDGKCDLAVFRRSPNRWYVLLSSDGSLRMKKLPGFSGRPVAGDFDGDRRADFATFNGNGDWQILTSSDGVVRIKQFGQAGDIPFGLDWDNDGFGDLAVYRPQSGTWYVQRSFFGFQAIQFGLGTDVPSPADYKGNGEIQPAVFRPSTGTWYILDGGFVNTYQFGNSTDIPAPSK
jgi:hypothetical protein